MRSNRFRSHLPAKSGTQRYRQNPLRSIPLIMMICLLLTGTVFGVAHYRAMRLNQVGQVEVFSADSGKNYHIPSNTIITVSEETEIPQTATIFSVRPTWLPDEIAQSESCTLRMHLHGTTRSTDHLAAEDLDHTYTRCITRYPDDSSEPSVNIEIFSGTTVANGSFIPHGTTTLEKEGTLCGMEAMWLKQDEADKEGNYAFSIRSLLLYDPEHACVIYIGTGGTAEDIGYELAEQVAAGLELVDSGIPCSEVKPLDWAILSIARG